MPQANPTPKHNQLGAQARDLIAKGQKYYVPSYKPREMILDHGKGSRLWDTDGKEYIDFGGGIAVTGFGHQDPDLVEALITQAKKLWHTSNAFYTAPPILLAEELVKAVPFAKRVFLTNSGAEANEAAIKLERIYCATNNYPDTKRNIITFTGSFHGRTLATVTATAQPKYQQGFEPLPGGFIYCDPFNGEAAIEKLVDENTCAVLVEPIQGEGGIVPAKPGFLKYVQDLCRKVDALFMLDEVQTGVGRTGKLFAHMLDPSLEPDVMTTAKALGGGVPIGAMLTGERCAEVLQFGSHGSTFGGNPVMSAVARVALRKAQEPKLVQNVQRQSETLRAALQEIGAELKLFKEIRGIGLMIGAELSDAWKNKAPDFMETARLNGVLILQAGPNVLRFLPALTITDQEMQDGIARLRAALQEQIGKAA